MLKKMVMGTLETDSRTFEACPVTVGAQHFTLLVELAIEFPDKLRERDADASTECTKFHHVNTSFAPLTLTYKRLSLLEPHCQFDLR